MYVKKKLKIRNSFAKYICFFQSGQFYVIKNSPTDYATINQRPASSKQESPTKSILPTKTKVRHLKNPKKKIFLIKNKYCLQRDERRRANHNEIERRRRDKINSWITELNSRIPETFVDSNRMLGAGADNLSKGGILAKACEYISHLEDLTKNNVDNSHLRAQNESLKKENEKLKQMLQQNGINTDNVET
jgi:upstream stimulatory factor